MEVLPSKGEWNLAENGGFTHGKWWIFPLKIVFSHEK